MLVFICSMLETEQERKKIAEFYEDYKSILMRHAMKITGNNQTMAEDAIHNAFKSIMENKKKYISKDEKDLFYSTLAIIKNKCIDLLRKEKPYSDTPIEEMEFFLESGDMPVEDQAEIDIAYAVILKYIKQLNEINKRVLVLKYFKYKTYKEIAKELNMTPKNVETRIARAKEKVRKLIRKERGEKE